MERFSGICTLSGVASPFVVLAAIALGGCGQSRPMPAAVAVPQAPVRPAWPSLPENAACTKELTQYQTVLDADVSTGNLNRSVYEEIEADLTRAASACANGK